MPPHEPTNPNEANGAPSAATTPAPAANPAPEPAPKPSAAEPKTLDPKSILLPKKEGGPSLDSAQRVNAGTLLAQEQTAGAEGTRPTIGELSKPAVAPPPPPKEEPVVQALETFGGDINRVVRTGEVTMASIAAAEAKRAHMAQGAVLPPGEIGSEPTQNSQAMHPVLYIAGGLLMLCALGIVAALFIHPSTGIIRQQTPDAPFMDVDQTIVVPADAAISRDTLMTNLNAARASLNIPLGLVAQLYVQNGSSTSQLPPQTLLSILAPDMPQDLLRTIQTPLLLAVHSFDENQAFLILHVDSYQQAYAGMLAWERMMQRDLLPLFTRTPPVRVLPQAADFNPTATSTASSTANSTTDQSELLQTGFVDTVVDNHDARAIKTAQGDFVLLWTFLDRNTLVIATNEYTLAEIIRRLNTASLLPQP